jgi:hypothetical protein
MHTATGYAPCLRWNPLCHVVFSCHSIFAVAFLLSPQYVILYGDTPGCVTHPHGGVHYPGGFLGKEKKKKKKKDEEESPAQRLLAPEPRELDVAHNVGEANLSKRRTLGQPIPQNLSTTLVLEV